MTLKTLPALLALLAVELTTRLAAGAEEHVRVATEDGADLSVKRYPSAAGEGSAGGQPVILCHGLGANRRLFDLEEVETPTFHYVGLATYLHGKGFDVWLPNFRGVGSGEEASHSPADRPRWTIDDIAAEDVPAVVRHVHQATGRSPLLVGHSMGALVTVIYLEGARRDTPERPGLVLDAELARDRERIVRGAVLIAPPLRMAWSKGREPRWLLWTSRTVALLGEDAFPPRFDLSRWALQRDHWFVEKLSSDALDTLIGKRSPQDRVLEFVFGARRNRPAVLLTKIWGAVLDDCSSSVLLQFADGIRTSSLRSSGKRRIDFPTGYDALRTPFLVVAGEHDGLVDPTLLEEEFVGARDDRRFVLFSGYGHADLVLGAHAPREVYPAIDAWLRTTACD